MNNGKQSMKKPYVIGKSIYFREISLDDAEFVMQLRLDTVKNKFISPTENDITQQKQYIENYFSDVCNKQTDFPIGTIRIYDIQNDSFCWGSWILSEQAPVAAAIESALLIYDFAFFSLHYKKSHFDVRKQNSSVLAFHKRFGAIVTHENELDYFFQYDMQTYLQTRKKYERYLP